MECPHLIIECKINRELVKAKKCQLIESKCNINTTNNISSNTSITTTTTSSTVTSKTETASEAIVDGKFDNIEVDPEVKNGFGLPSTAPTLAALPTLAESQICSNMNSQKWKCDIEDCDAKNNWLCLNCGIVLCGRYERGHALNHFNTKNHKVCLSILDFSAYCYKCDNFVVNSTPQLDEIRQFLRNEDDTKSETSSNNEESVSFSGSSLKSSSNNSNASISSNDFEWEEPLQIDGGRWLRPRKRTNSSYSSSENGNNKGRKVQRRSNKDNDANNTNSGGGGVSKSGSPTQNKNFRRLVGIRNFNKTCFMNSVLQSLSQIPEFSCYISSLPNLEKDSNTSPSVTISKPKQRVYNSRSMKENYDDSSILRDLRRLFLDLSNNTNGRAVAPEYLLNWNFPQFDMNEQNDAHEFLRYMLDRLHTELQHLSNNEKSNLINSCSTGSTELKDNGSSNSNNNSNGCANGSESTNKNNSNNNCSSGNNINCNTNGIYNYRGSKSSIVTNVFGGVLQNEVRCLVCGMESIKHDPFLDLSLDIPEKFYKDCATPAQTSATKTDAKDSSNLRNSNDTNPECSIKDCISSFMEVEELSIRERYYCSSCKRNQKSTKKFWIRRLPNVLCLHIKRFRWNTQKFPYAWSKIDLKITFPLSALDMSQYLMCSGSEARKNTQTNNIYDLGAVIVHDGSGKSANFGGHYTSYAINNGSWFHFNDDSVREVPASKVIECKPYMLFYIRRDTTKTTSSPLSSSLYSPNSAVPGSSTPSATNQKLTSQNYDTFVTNDANDNKSDNNSNKIRTKVRESSTRIKLSEDAINDNTNSTLKKTL